LAWQVTNRSFIDDESIEPRKRMCTTTEEVDSCTIFPQRGQATGEYIELCQQVASYLERTVTPTIRLAELAADFIKDPSGRIWLLQVKSLKVQHPYIGRALQAPTLDDSDAEAEASSSKKKGPSGYKKLIRCFSCLTECTGSELPFSMSTQMTMQTEHHLRRRGKFLPWFCRPDFSRKMAKGELYEPHKVCQRCYLMYKAEQQLIEVEEQFARAIGVPVDAQESAATGSDVRHPARESNVMSRAMPPSRIGMYRFYVFLNDLVDLPEWDTLELPVTASLYCEFKLFGLTTRILIPREAMPSNEEGGGKNDIPIPIRQMRTFHFFCSDEHELKAWFDAHQSLNVTLYADPRKILGVASLPLRLFRGQTATKVDFSQLFSPATMQLTTLRASLGVVHHGEVDTMLISLQPIDGVWQPSPSFYTCDALPDEWLELLTRFTIHGAQSPSKRSIGPPQSVREAMSPKSPNRSPRPPRPASPWPPGGKSPLDLDMSGYGEDLYSDEYESEEEEGEDRVEQRIAVAGGTAEGSQGASTRHSFWALKFSLESIQDAAPLEGDAWQLSYKVLGRSFSTLEVRAAGKVMPLAFNTIQRLYIRGDAEALRLWLEHCVIEFDIRSKLEPRCHRSVSIELEELFASRGVQGTYDVLTKSSEEKPASPYLDDGSFKGEQLLVGIHLEDLNAEAEQLRGHSLAHWEAFKFSPEEVAPGLRTLVVDKGPIPALATDLTEPRSRAWGSENLSGPMQHTVAGDAFKEQTTQRDLDLEPGVKWV